MAMNIYRFHNNLNGLSVFKIRRKTLQTIQAEVALPRQKKTNYKNHGFSTIPRGSGSSTPSIFIRQILRRTNFIYSVPVKSIEPKKEKAPEGADLHFEQRKIRMRRCEDKTGQFINMRISKYVSNQYKMVHTVSLVI